ncbi:MAG TPA: hypothetical protein VKR06_43805 [Ktedonosporobacter sp.]|nr:hypothetical protein [Ktedonosporobacter sp.]
MDLLKKSELHVHIPGCYFPEDLLELAKDCYRDINWNRFGFLDRYERIFGIRLNPIDIFDRALATDSLDELRSISTYSYKPQGRFEEFDITSFFSMCITGYYLDRDMHEPILRPIVARHKREGIAYIEYRIAFGGDKQEFKDWHGRYARYFRQSSTVSFAAKYIVRLFPNQLIESYEWLRELLHEQPELIDTIVGIDFSGREIAPKSLHGFYEILARDNQSHPESALDVAVHIGESFFGLSLESAIRWCHQSALFGAKRLGHCIALGMQPAIAVSRKPAAHTRESIQERLDQIDYDLEHASNLRAYGIVIDEDELRQERKALEDKDPAQLSSRVYDEQRLQGASLRQDYVLDALSRMGTIIETCPTSNLCIGGVPNIQAHPFIKLYKSGVHLAICSDDPGIFASTLADEIEFVCKTFAIEPGALAERLGDPWRFRLAAQHDSL